MAQLRPILPWVRFCFMQKAHFLFVVLMGRCLDMTSECSRQKRTTELELGAGFFASAPRLKIQRNNHSDKPPHVTVA